MQEEFKGEAARREAVALVMTLATASKLQVQRGEDPSRRLTLDQSMMSRPVSSALFTIGLHALGLKTTRIESDGALSFGIGQLDHVPAAILGVAFDYAAMAAPRVETGVINYDELLATARLLNEKFGPFDVDVRLLRDLDSAASALGDEPAAPGTTV